MLQYCVYYCLLLFDSNSAIMNHTFNSEQRNPMTICLVTISHKTQNYTTDIKCSIVLAINEPYNMVEKR